MTFQEYLRFKKPICSIRSFIAIIRYRIDESWDLESLITLPSVGHKTALDIINLQRKYKSKGNVL